MKNTLAKLDAIAGKKQLTEDLTRSIVKEDYEMTEDGANHSQDDPWALGYGHYHRELYNKPHPKNPFSQEDPQHHSWQRDYDEGHRERRRERSESVENNKNSLKESEVDEAFGAGPKDAPRYGKKVTDENAMKVKALAKEFFGDNIYSSVRIAGGTIYRMSFRMGGIYATYRYIKFAQVPPQVIKNLKEKKAKFLAFCYKNGIEPGMVDLKYHIGAGIYASVRAKIGQVATEDFTGGHAQVESKLDEKSTSEKQARTMTMAAHNPKMAKKVGIPTKVAKEFNKADKGTKQLSRAMKHKKPYNESEVDEHIVKSGSQYELKSHTGKNLGKFKSHKAAAKHEGEVEWFKSHPKESIEMKTNESPKGSTEPLSVGDEVRSRNPNNGTYGMMMKVVRIEGDQYFCAGNKLQTMPYRRGQLELLNPPKAVTEDNIDDIHGIVTGAKGHKGRDLGDKITDVLLRYDYGNSPRNASEVIRFLKKIGLTPNQIGQVRDIANQAGKTALDHVARTENIPEKYLSSNLKDNFIVYSPFLNAGDVAINKWRQLTNKLMMSKLRAQLGNGAYAESKGNDMKKKSITESAITNDPSLDKVLRHFGKEVEDFKNGGDLDDHLYNALYDFWFDEMPYGTKKARDGDPYAWVSQRLDQELNPSYGKPRGDAAIAGYGDDPMGEWHGQNESLGEDGETDLDDLTDNHSIESLEDAEYVQDLSNGTEVFRMSGDPYERRVRIDDKNGRGWYISPSRLTPVFDQALIARWFPDEGDIDEGAAGDIMPMEGEIDEALTPAQQAKMAELRKRNAASPTVIGKNALGPQTNPNADLLPKRRDDNMRGGDLAFNQQGAYRGYGESLDESGLDEAFLVEENEDLITSILEGVGLDHGLDFFFDNGLVAIGKSTARVIINALRSSPDIKGNPSIGGIDGEEVQITFDVVPKEVGPELSVDDIPAADFNPDEPNELRMGESVVREDVSMSITAQGEDDVVNIIRKLSGLGAPEETAVMSAEPDMSSMMNAIDSATQGPEEEIEIVSPDAEVEEGEGEYVNAPDPSVHTSTTDMINRGDDLNRPKRQNYDIRNLGNNPMAEARNLMKQYEAFKDEVKVK